MRKLNLPLQRDYMKKDIDDRPVLSSPAFPEEVPDIGVKRPSCTTSHSSLQ